MQSSVMHPAPFEIAAAKGAIHSKYAMGSEIESSSLTWETSRR
jgi:hypothetical protein